MRPGQNNKQRMRSRNPGNSRKGPNPLTRSYESNGPDVKVRGTAHHVGEKYLQLARDAQTSGDPVMAESYLQHAEHYFRIIATAQLQQLQAQEGYVRPEGEALIDDTDDDDLVGGLPDRFASPLERVVTPPPVPAFVPPQPNYTPQANPYQNRQQNYGERNGNDRSQYQDRPPQNRQRPERQDRNFQDRNFQDRNNQERSPQDRAAQERAAQERAAQERAAQERLGAEWQAQERPVVESLPVERPQQQDMSPDRNQDDRTPQRHDEDRQRYERPVRQDRFQPERYAQERPVQNRDARQDHTRQDRDTRPDRNRQERDGARDGAREGQRDNRQPREFRPRFANSEPRANAPDAIAEAPLLPSFITAPVRVIAPVEPVSEPVAFVPTEPFALREAEVAAPVERVRRRRVTRPVLDDPAPEVDLAGPAPSSGTD